MKVVKGIDARIKVINDHGSLLETRIGNYRFKITAEGTHGIKLNNEPLTDHRMITDKCRTNMPPTSGL